MQKKYIPSVIALALLGTVALPVAAHAAPATTDEPRIKTPQIEGIGADGWWNAVGSLNQANDEVSVKHSAFMSIGSDVRTTGFKNKTVVVSDEDGKRLCDSSATAATSKAWSCVTTGDLLAVGDHTLTAVAYSKDGSRHSGTSRPVTVHVLEAGPVVVVPDAPKVTVVGTGESTVVRITVGTPYGVVKTFDEHGKLDVTRTLDEHGAADIPYGVGPNDPQRTLTAVAYNVKGEASEPTGFTIGSGEPDTTAVQAPGPVDTGFTVVDDRQDSIAVPAPGEVDAGFTAGTGSEESAAPTAPKVAIEGTGPDAVLHVTGGAPHGSVKTFRADGAWEKDFRLDEHGATDIPYSWAPDQAIETHTAVTYDTEGRASEPTAFTIGNEHPDTTTVEAPGFVDPGFAVPGGDQSVARPELGSVHEFNRNGAHWMVVNAKGVAGAEAVFTDAHGVETKGEFSSTGSLVIRIDLPYGAEPVLTLVQEVDGVASAPVTVRPNK